MGGLVGTASVSTLAGSSRKSFLSSWDETARSYDGGLEVHVGVEEPFVPARKAHPAVLLDDVAELDRVATRLGALGHEVDHSERDTFPGHVRWHVRDGHGNRVELLAPAR